MTALQKTKSYAKKAYEQINAPVPTWAKWCRNIGIVTTIVGGQIMANPDIYPSGIDHAAIYMVNIGTIATAIFQAFKKK